MLRTDLPGVAPVHDPVASVVLAMDTRAVDSVIVGGRFAKQDTEGFATLAESAARVTATA